MLALPHGGAGAHRQVLRRPRGRAGQHRHRLPVARSVSTDATSRSSSTTRPSATTPRAATHAACSSARRTWSASCSTRTSCRSTTRARKTAAATSSRSTSTAHARWRRTAGRAACCRSTRSSASSTSARRRCTTRIRRGVVHRDIKPSNILLTQDGDVRIVDFGIALVADSDVSRLEGVAGSPAYMSPEQVQGLELDARSDLYSLGAVMYEMLCGHAAVPRRGARQAPAPGGAGDAEPLRRRAAGDSGGTRDDRASRARRRNPASATAAARSSPPT